MKALLAIAGFVAQLCRLVAAIDAGPNTLAFYNPTLRTASFNATWMIIPVPAEVAAAAVSPYKLINCASNRTLFPNGFPEGHHPLLVNIGYQYDIRMSSFEIDALTTSIIQVTCVDRLGDGKTLFGYPVRTYIGGADGQPLMAYVPSVVGSLENQPILVANVYPDNRAYRPLGAGLYASQVKQRIVPNSVSGPGVVPAVVDFIFSGVSSNQYTPHTFHALISQVVIATTSVLRQCVRNPYYFNETFAQPALRTGTVTLYNGTGGFDGRYTGVGGYSANAELVGYNPQDCAQAAAQNDPAAQA